MFHIKFKVDVSFTQWLERALKVHVNLIQC